MAKLLPIAGNACEHLGAVRFAMDDKPGLAVAWVADADGFGRFWEATGSI